MILLHKKFIKDKIRCQAYQKAIREVIKQGDVVIDIGAGSGLLSYFALRAGARKVYAIEQNGSLIDAARKIAKANGLDKKITFIKGNSAKVTLPEKADVVICEIIGFLLLEENIIKYLHDARARFLKRTGILMPSHGEIIIAPIEAPKFYRQRVDFWRGKKYGIDFSEIRNHAVNCYYPIKIKPADLLASPAAVCSADFYKIKSARQLYPQGVFEFDIARDGMLYGLGAWFCVKLSRSISLSNLPGSVLHWKQRFFPIQNPAPLKKGDRIRGKIIGSYLPGTMVWSWSIEVQRKKKRDSHDKSERTYFKHSTLYSKPLSRQTV
ncbi:MAG: 50S ribosomal protein L11 methyltransferase [Candidatus Omnitrophica bacterium]|nr:50S ribosomal protein L11 methyltransferase [Candidatus Omnitrophota bacterium]MBU1925744.1 50S ribosomal protein L11 methyltransferase [Candidatus Omnitrophota bacterium]